MFSSNQSIPIGAKVEISIKGFTLGVKAEIYLFFKNLPQVTNKCSSLWPCIWQPRLEKGYHPIWEANLQLLGPMFQHLLISWHQCSSIY
jgi:hypothetical protein